MATVHLSNTIVDLVLWRIHLHGAFMTLLSRLLILFFCSILFLQVRDVFAGAGVSVVLDEVADPAALRTDETPDSKKAPVLERDEATQKLQHGKAVGPSGHEPHSSNPSRSELTTFKEAFESLRNDPVHAAMLASRLAQRKPALPKPLLANVLWIQGSGLSISEEHSEALQVLSQAEQLAREIHDNKLLRRILRYKSASALECSEFIVGAAAATEALDLSHQMQDDSAYLAVLHNELAGNEAGLGNKAIAIEHFQKALEISQFHGDLTVELQVLANLGQIFIDLQRHEDVIKVNQQVLSKVGVGLDPQSFPVLSAHISLGESYVSLGKLKEADTHLKSAIEMCTQPGSESLRGSAEAVLGRYCLAMKNLPEARKHFTTSLKIFESLENASGIAAAEQGLRVVADSESSGANSDQARIAEIKNQLLQADRAANPELAISLHRELAGNLEHAGNWEEATFHLKKVVELVDRVRNQQVDKTVAGLLSKMHITQKERDLAALRHESELNSHRLQAQERWNAGLFTCVLTLFIVIVVIGRLLSQNKRTVRELKEAHDELREQRRLQIKMERRLAEQQKSQSLELMASGIAHDFNNLLAGIAGLAELGTQSASVDRKNELLKQIGSTTLQASGLTGQLQQFLGKPGQEMAQCDVTDVVESTHCLLQSVARPVMLILHGGHGVIKAEIDETRLRQVLVNLVANAAEASRRDGHVTVSVDTDTLTAADLQTLNCDVDVQPGDYCRIRVEDNGHGMSEETKQRLFDPYFTTKALGRGLGLSSVIGILRSCRGIISVDSQLGSGCRVTVWLRVAGNPAIPEDSSLFGANETDNIEMNSDDATKITGRILLVDDESLLLDLQSEFLSTLGYEVTSASSAEEALSLFRQHKMQFDCVVTDYSMPGHNGRWLAEQIASVKPGLPVILCSGYASVNNDAEQRSAIACELAKPYSPSVLCQKIRECVHATLPSDSSSVVGK